MTKPAKTTFPLAGGVYARDDSGLRQLEKPTAPPAGKSVDQAEPAKPATTKSKPDAVAKTP